MWFPPNTALSDSHDDTAFILLAWAELFGEHTPDSFRPRLHDARSLLGELSHVADLTQGDPRWKQHLLAVQQELQLATSECQVFEHGYPHIHSAINNLGDEGDSRRLARLCKVALDQTEDYRARLSERAVDTLRQLPRRKEAMLRCLSAIATRARAEGVDWDQCRTPIRDSSLTLSPPDALDEILTACETKVVKWLVILGVCGPRDDIQSLVTRTDFALLPAKMKPLGRTGTEFLAQAKQATFVFRQVEANSAGNALHTSIPQLRRVTDIHNLFGPERLLRLHENALVQEGRNQHIVPIRGSSNVRLGPRRGVRMILSSLFRHVPESQLPNQLCAALELHSVSQIASDLRVAFTNLWAALETIANSGGGKSLIEKVQFATLPTLLARRTNKLIKYLGICLHRVGFCGKIPDTSGCFVRSDSSQIRRDELLLTLCGAAGPLAECAVASATSNHLLLRHRIYNLWKTLKKPANLRKDLKAAKRRIAWHVLRLYRVRNLIVHHGCDQKDLPYLHDNLLAYFTILSTQILRRLEHHRHWGVSEILEDQSIRYQHLFECLNRSPDKVSVSDVLWEGGPYASRLLWP